jgi:hypothetical protein
VTGPAFAEYGLGEGERAALADLAPLLRRVAGLDPAGLVRLVRRPGRTAAFVRLPFGVLAARTLALAAQPDDPATGERDPVTGERDPVTGGGEPAAEPGEPAAPVQPVAGSGWDITVVAAELLAWLEQERPDPPVRCDEQWRGALPPAAGWRRVDTVPDAVVRNLVRTGALALKDAAAREGVPGAQPRAEVADALLDAVVLTLDDERGARAEVTLRSISALTRMGFLPRESHVAVDVFGRWTRVAAAYGSVYAERASLGLGLGPRAH